MQDTNPSPKQKKLTDLSPYIYGTTRLGDQSIDFNDRVKIARAVMDAGVWMHTSDQYNDALQVLGTAFAEDPANIPDFFVKIGWDSIDQLRTQIISQLKPLGLDHLPVGQLCLGDNLAREFKEGGPCYEGFQQLKEEGLVGRFVVEIFPWTSQAPMEALQADYAQQGVDGFIFYFNPMQRFASNDLFNLIVKKDQAIVAMRTVSGGNIYRMRDVPGAAPEYLQKRAVQVAPLFEESGCSSWTEFCVRYVYSIPQVRTTVGSTSRLENLREYIRATKDAQPLEQSIVDELLVLQTQWHNETDRHAKPWSM